MKTLIKYTLIFVVLFLNLYGQGYKMKNLGKLLESENPTAVIIKIDDYICEISENGKYLERLTNPQKIFFHVQELEREINNGGFDQYFHNSTGDFSKETLEALKLIDAKHTIKIFIKACSIFPKKEVEKNRNKRIAVIEGMEEFSSTVWEECDNMFYEYKDNLEELILKYVKTNLSKF